LQRDKAKTNDEEQNDERKENEKSGELQIEVSR